MAAPKRRTIHPETTTQRPAGHRAAKWLVALAPVFPPLYLAAFAALRQLRILPRAVQLILAFFVLTQVVAALFTPSPLLSVPLAVARAALVLAMIAAGVYLRDSRALRPIVWGYAVVFLTAWAFTLATAGPDAALHGRLGHPIYYVVSLGLLAAIALWIIVSWKGASPWWRFPLGALALVTMAATGSRGPVVALAVGAAAALLAGNLRYLRALALVALLGAAVVLVVPYLSANTPLDRVGTVALSGRDQVWAGAIDAFRASPIGGQGPYQIGPYLGFLYEERCQLTPTLEQAGITCPDWIARFKGAWLIAHNVVLHALAETGLIGTFGLLTLLALGALATFRSRDGLLLAIFWGFMVMNLVDVVTAVPSPHFAELFWVVVGIALVRTMTGTAEIPER